MHASTTALCSLLPALTLAQTVTAQPTVFQRGAAAFEPTAYDCDLDESGQVEVNDILEVLSTMSVPCDLHPCRGDVNRDGTRNVVDLMLILSFYGTATPEIVSPIAETEMNGARICLQSRFSSSTSRLHDMGIANDAVCVSSYAFLAHSGDMTTAAGLEKVLTTSRDAIAERLTSYADNNDIPLDTEGIVIIDIEGPQFSPVYFGNYLDTALPTYDPALLDRILDAYKLRIDVAREVFPQAKLGLYDSITPHPFGDAALASMIRRQLGYDYAAANGLFDGLDYACPVVYEMWGVTDIQYVRHDAVPTLGIEATRSLRKTTGEPLELMPMLSLTVFNGSSNHNREPALVSDVNRTIEILKGLGVNDYLIWNGNENLVDTDICLYDHLQELADYRAAAAG